MPTTVVIILTAVVVAVGGYLTNQLPEVPQFKGHNRLLIRLFVWIMLLPVAYELLTSDQVAESVKTVARYNILPVILFLLLDLYKLVAVLRGRGIMLMVERLGLRTRLLKAVQGDVAERLEDSLNQQVVINLLMHSCTR
ncbi:hypothetical protein Lepto7375DRAFT_5219 [Leptolyngbya sp. PCC 7375]|nr:hypothetical protein Lepto7375DRAFT_5219 [Leptolyngbya sp. PCC 7375]